MTMWLHSKMLLLNKGLLDRPPVAAKTLRRKTLCLRSAATQLVVVVVQKKTGQQLHYSLQHAKHLEKVPLLHRQYLTRSMALGLALAYCAHQLLGAHVSS